VQLITVLPTGIVGAIDAIATTKHQLGRFVKLLSYMLGKCLADKVDFDTPLEISKEHFRNQVGVHYLKDLQALCEAKIVTTNHEYTLPKTNQHTGEKIAQGQCKRYSFNQDLVFTSPDFVAYHEKTSKQFDTSFVVRETVNLLARLSHIVDLRNLKRIVFENVNRDYVLERCKVDSAIPQGNYQIKGTKQIRSLAYILELATKNNQNAILYNKEIHLAELETWVSKTQNQIRTAHMEANIKLKNIRQRHNVYCKRNDRNRRLDTNLTNLKANSTPTSNDGYFQYLRLDGERLWSIDKCNSQFTLLAKVIEIWQNANNQNFTNGQFKENSNLIGTCEAAKSSGDCFKDCRDKSKVSFNKYSYQHIIDSIPYINVAHIHQKTGKKTAVTNCNSNSLCSQKKSTKHSTEKLNMSDLEEFKTATRAGNFYETFQDILKSEGQNYTRGQVKKMMFQTLFSAASYNPAEKQLLAKHFPNLVGFTNEFKRAWRDFYVDDGKDYNTARQLGKASLAVTLQQIESAIFIDCILTRLLKSGYRVFTKHDSILCKESDAAAVTAIVREELNRELGIGAYTLKTELA
jgi:hypothetical protein